MKSSPSFALAVVVALVLSVGLKVALAPPATRAASAPQVRGEALRKFLVSQVGPLEPVDGGWRYAHDGCRVLVFPSGRRGAMDMEALAHAGRHDRVAYVYRGRVTAERPTVALAFDHIAYLATRPFWGAAEPGYLVVITRNCQALPDLPWGQLWT